MWKMSKSPFVMVLIAMMAAGNALPLWADSARRTPEIKRADLRNNRSAPTSSFATELVGEPVPVGNCDDYYDLLIMQARGAAANAKARARLAEARAQLLLTTRLNEFLTSQPPPSPAEVMTNYTNYLAESQALKDGLEVELDEIDAALALAIAALELAKWICNQIY